jgi:hypothetical protein
MFERGAPACRSSSISRRSSALVARAFFAGAVTVARAFFAAFAGFGLRRAGAESGRVIVRCLGKDDVSLHGVTSSSFYLHTGVIYKN